MHALILFMITVAQEHQHYQLQHQVDALQARLTKLQTLARADAQPKTCSIPLINALPADPSATSKMPVVKPEGQFHIQQVNPPAPPCENWGK